MRVFYTGVGATDANGAKKWHTSYFDLYFEGNDSTVCYPLWNIPGHPSAPDNTVLFFDQVRSGTRYLFIDSATAADAYDTVYMMGMIPNDFQCDSAIIEFKTSSAVAADIVLDSITGLIPKVSKYYADSIHSTTGTPTDSVSTSIVRVAFPFDHKFWSGEEAGIKLHIKIPTTGKTLSVNYAALKGRKR
jgi:hypothetical protein